MTDRNPIWVEVRVCGKVIFAKNMMDIPRRKDLIRILSGRDTGTTYKVLSKTWWLDAEQDDPVSSVVLECEEVAPKQYL